MLWLAPNTGCFSLYILNLELNDVSATSYEEPVTKNFEPNQNQHANTGLTRKLKLTIHLNKLD